MRKNLTYKIAAFILAISIPLNSEAANGYESSDWMRSNGYIFVVIGVLVIIFTGLFIYMLIQDKKLSRLENQINQKDHE